MQYVYIGNVPGGSFESTYCPSCGSLLIYRNGFSSEIRDIDEDGRCKKCGFSTGIVLKHPLKQPTGGITAGIKRRSFL